MDSKAPAIFSYLIDGYLSNKIPKVVSNRRSNPN